MKQEVWIIGLDREVWIGLDRRSGSGVWIACGFWGLIRTSNFEVQPYMWGWLLMVPSQGYHHFPYELRHMQNSMLHRSICAFISYLFLQIVRVSTWSPCSRFENDSNWFWLYMICACLISHGSSWMLKTSQDMASKMSQAKPTPHPAKFQVISIL